MTALSESLCLMSIYNVLSWPILTLLLFSWIRKPVLDKRPQLEDVNFTIGTTLVRIEGPEEVQSSGIESKAGERSNIISSWCRAAVEQPWPRPTTAVLIEGLF